MSIQQISNYSDANTNYISNKESKKVKEELAPVNTDEAAVYEKSPADKKVHKRDQATIDRLLSEAETGANRLRDLVERMLLKQGETFNKSTNIYSLLREGKVQVDEETRLQAQKDIAEDGYW